MYGLKKTIEDYRKKNLGTEKTMWDSIDLLDEMIFMPLMKEHKDMYWSFMRELHELYMGEHFDEKFAKYEVENMHHTGIDGVKYHGGKWSIDQTTPIFAKIKSQLKSPYNEWDWFVTLNMVYSDFCILFNKWFQGETEDQLTQRYIDLAINFLNDEDYGDGKRGKIWSYFEEMHE